MPTLRQLIHYLAPAGTNPQRGQKLAGAGGDPWAVVAPNYDRFPLWPPDLFAIAGTLVSQSECYAHSRYADTRLFNRQRLGVLRRLAKRFQFPFTLEEAQQRGMSGDDMTRQRDRWQRVLYNPRAKLFQWWDELYNRSGDVLMDDPVDPANPPVWWDAALQLMIVADEACLAVGFVAPAMHPMVAANMAMARYFQYTDHVKNKPNERWPGGPYLVQFPTSLCAAVPACKACVQPKTHTVQVGCTLNCLSRHVALLPPHSQVKSEWRWGVERADIPKPEESLFDKVLKTFDVLLVPFPYRVDDNAFVPGQKCSPDPADPAHFFGMTPTWLGSAAGLSVTPEQFVDDLLLPLIEKANAAGRSPEWVVLPELALTEAMLGPVAERLAAKTANLQLFISGYGTSPDIHGFARNGVYGAIFGWKKRAPGELHLEEFEREVADEWWQSKHHRWKLESQQVDKYGLGAVLDRNRHWWEGIEVYDRKCVFWVFRGLASMTTLVCEDLARVHPVQPVLRAVGPNLVMALLMDDEQIEYRWSPRYAMALADDPGSSVLAVTSLGLIHRACRTDPGRQTPTAAHKIAVWREAPRMPGDEGDAPPDGLTEAEWNMVRNSRALPLELPVGHHAMVLTVGGVRTTAYSLDGRTDQGLTVRLRLMGRQSLAHPKLPAWANYPFAPDGQPLP